VAESDNKSGKLLLSAIVMGRIAARIPPAMQNTQYGNKKDEFMKLKSFALLSTVFLPR